MGFFCKLSIGHCHGSGLPVLGMQGVVDAVCLTYPVDRPFCSGNVRQRATANCDGCTAARRLPKHDIRADGPRGGVSLNAANAQAAAPKGRCC
jgi:hypothetical protein